MSEPSPSAPPPPKKPISVLRGLFATLGAIIMALTGGCALLATIGGGGINANDLQLVLVFAGPPFLVGLGIFLAATRLGRK
jgi:hypothetical protein